MDDYSIENINESGSFSINYYCCQEGRNCEDGFEGCEPSCTSCCNVDDCGSLIFSSNINHFICVDGVCANYRMSVPALFTGDDAYTVVDWGSIDFTSQAYTCNALKLARTNLLINTGNFCQTEDGKDDVDFPCVIRLVSIDDESSECPTNCNV